MKFVMAYSCGKDSTLALHSMIKQGHEPVALITMFDEEANRSFFHGADYKMIQAYSEALRILVLITSTKGANYHLAMEESLKKLLTWVQKWLALATLILKVIVNGLRKDPETLV